MTAATEIHTGHFLALAALVTRPGRPPILQWVVDTGRDGKELAVFHQGTLGGAGILVEHPPARGAPQGFTEIRLAVSDIPADVSGRLPYRLRAAIARRGW